MFAGNPAACSIARYRQKPGNLFLGTLKKEAAQNTWGPLEFTYLLAGATVELQNRPRTSPALPELELEVTQTHTTQKPVLRVEVGAYRFAQ